MNVRPKTEKHYLTGINKVIQYIDSHLDENLDINQLASLGCYSPFHFHRIMRAWLNEPLGTYITRTRLEYASQLLRHSNEPVTEIALRVGYENLSSFSKAFKKRFVIAPVEYRLHRTDLLMTESVLINNHSMKYLIELTPKIKTISARRMIYAQGQGSYFESYKKAWPQVCAYALEHHLFGPKNEYIGIGLDDPSLTETENIRYNACITIGQESIPEGSDDQIKVLEIPEGKYAIFTHRGPYEELKNSYHYIYGQWLAESKVKLRNQHCLQRYLNSPEDAQPEELLTEIMVPIF